jgi:hypothetical protein
VASSARRRRGRLSVLVALVVLSIAGCGGAERGEGRTNIAASTAIQTNGLEKKSAAQVEQEAAAALEAAGSVHVTGTGQSDGSPSRLDMRFQGASSSGTVETAGVTFAITTTGTATYIKADQRAWQEMGVPASVQRTAAGRWVKLGEQQAKGLGDLSLRSLAAELTKNDSPLQSAVEQATFEGSKVVVIGQQDGSRLYVANIGPAYPLHADNKGKDAFRLDFTEYGTDFHIAAPSDALDMDSLG